MSPEKINLAEKFSRISEHWSPKIAGEINDSYVKLVKVKGEFVWHHHENEDELFLVTKGRLQLRFRDREVWARAWRILHRATRRRTYARCSGRNPRRPARA